MRFLPGSELADLACTARHARPPPAPGPARPSQVRVGPGRALSSLPSCGACRRGSPEPALRRAQQAAARRRWSRRRTHRCLLRCQGDQGATVPMVNLRMLFAGPDGHETLKRPLTLAVVRSDLNSASWLTSKPKSLRMIRRMVVAS